MRVVLDKRQVCLQRSLNLYRDFNPGNIQKHICLGEGDEIREGLQYQGRSVKSRRGLEVLGKDFSEEGKLSGPDWIHACACILKLKQAYQLSHASILRHCIDFKRIA